MSFEKGQGGRNKGSLNRLTAEVRDMIAEALSRVGGASYLEEQANKNPVAFMALVGKLLPLQLKADITKRKIVVHVGLSGDAGNGRYPYQLGDTSSQAVPSVSESSH